MKTQTGAVVPPVSGLGDLNNFVHRTIQCWYRGAGLKIKVKPIVCPLSGLDYGKLCEDIDPEKFGEYTLNSATMPIRWGIIPVEKFVVLAFEEWVGSPLSDVVKQAIGLYGETHHIPGVECQEYFIKNLDRGFDILRASHCYFFAGSVIRNRYGYATVPNSSWEGGLLRCDGRALSQNWTAVSRIVLAEK